MSVLESIGCTIGSLIILIGIYLFISTMCKRNQNRKESATVWMKVTERGERGQGGGDILLGPIVEEDVPIVDPD